MLGGLTVQLHRSFHHPPLERHIVTSLEIRSGTDVPDNVIEMMQTAKFLSNSKMLPKHLVGDEASVFSVMLAARSLNIPMWAAMQQIIVQQGRTSMTSSLMQSLVLRSGWNLYVRSSSNEGATVRAERPGIGVDGCGWADVSFTLEQALTAGLLTKNPQSGKLQARSQNGNKLPWELYTEDMFVSKAIARGARRYFADVLMGMLYTPDEVGVEIDEDGQPVKAGSVTVEVPDNLRKYALKIAAAETSPQLRSIYNELVDLGLDLDEVDGITLSNRIKIRLADVAPDEVKKPGAPAAEPAADAPADDSGPVDAETVPLGDDGEPTAEPDAPAEPEQADGFDELAAEVAAGDLVVADPEAEREDTPRRQAIENQLTELLDGWPAVETAATEHFRISPELVSTARLQDWLLQLRKDAK